MKILQLWARFWATDQSLSLLLLMTVLVGLVLPPLGSMDNPMPQDIVFSLLIVSGLLESWREGGLRSRLVVPIALFCLTFRWLGLLVWNPQGYSSWNAAADIFVLFTFVVAILIKVLRPGTITSQRLQGAVATYLLLGLLWGKAFEWIGMTVPGSFAGVGQVTGAPWIYFSYVTLTTMGYGDIIPLDPVARSLANAEALTGQLFIAILISRLVALELAAKRESSSH